MTSWYFSALTALLEEINASNNGRVDGSEFIRNYIDRNCLAEGIDDDDVEVWVNNEIDSYESWLKSEAKDLIIIGRNYFWSQKNSNKIETIVKDKIEPNEPDYSQELTLIKMNNIDLDSNQAKMIYRASMIAAKDNDSINAFLFAEKYYDYLNSVDANDSEKLKALNALLRACIDKSGQKRANTYEYFCMKAEIFIKLYEHSEAAKQYHQAIEVLESEYRPKHRTLKSISKNREQVEPRIQNIEEILKSIFQKCRVQYQNAGMSDEASEIYVKESKHIQKSLKFGGKFILMWLLWVFARYGESPRRVACWAAIVIFGFAFFYMYSGINTPSGLTEFSCSGAINGFKCNELALDLYEKPNYWVHLYYSVVTFTTLGYGDFTPTSGFSRFLSASQALLGLLLTSLFLGTFIKKYSR